MTETGSKNTQAFPPILDAAEATWIQARREAINADATATGKPETARLAGDAPRVGLALSGGGIRSATFSLGVLQALARLGLLRRFDYLSTVSGGGYIGGFLGRLYARHYATPSVVDWLLHPQRSGQPRPDWNRVVARDETTQANLRNLDPFDWLRDNGRYLAPNGTGDVLLAFAVAIRNWVALNLVFLSFLLLPLLAAQLLRRWIETGCLGAWLRTLPPGPAVGLTQLSGGLLEWSPFLDLSALVFCIAAFPLGWAFWLIERKREGWRHPANGVVLLILIAGTALLFRGPEKHFAWWAPLLRGAIFASLAAAGVALYAYQASDNSVRNVRDLDGDRRTQARYLLSVWLARSIGVALAIAAFAVVDTIGQSFYDSLRHGEGGVSGWIAGLVAAATPLAVRLSQLPAQLAALTGGRNKTGFKLPVTTLATLAAAVLATIVLAGLDAFAHGLADGFVALGERPRHLWLPEATLVALFAFACLFGNTWTFLNRSSQAALYRARLARAYLGASNWRRFLKGREASVADSIAGDDIRTEDYWTAAVRHGGPLHLLNVTINETAGDDAKTVVRDRKGIALAAGPCGYSAGIRHHAVRVAPPPHDNVAPPLPDHPLPGPIEPLTITGPGRTGEAPGRERIAALREVEGFSMFHRRARVAPRDRVGISAGALEASGAVEDVEAMSLGQWVAISGAAFTTGLGSRTSLGLSLLLGFANVRLGWWWDAGSRTRPREGLAALVRWLFPVQSYLLDEFTATFRGPGARRWYLSDGGHFENMGAYELIRRRLPMIVIVDGEEDEDYTYEGVANLVRKARLDFNAEIEFLHGKALEGVLHQHLLALFGGLDEMRPEKPEDDAPGARFSKKRAALAVVRYDGSTEPQSLIVYLKATLAADDPADVREYGAKHPAFPQESTLDQFFDESQWESYRKLGEVIATRVFQPQGPDGKPRFRPSSLNPDFRKLRDSIGA